jgi:hypothetical protein
LNRYALLGNTGAAIAAGGAAAIEGLTRGLAVELPPVRVNAVRPGAIRTPLWDPVPVERRTALFAALAERTLAKTVGEPRQIAAAQLDLMDNRFVTGTVLTVDGGAVLTGRCPAPAGQTRGRAGRRQSAIATVGNHSAGHSPVRRWDLSDVMNPLPNCR